MTRQSEEVEVILFWYNFCDGRFYTADEGMSYTRSELSRMGAEVFGTWARLVFYA